MSTVKDETVSFVVPMSCLKTVSCFLLSYGCHVGICVELVTVQGSWGGVGNLANSGKEIELSVIQRVLTACRRQHRVRDEESFETICWIWFSQQQH